MNMVIVEALAVGAYVLGVMIGRYTTTRSQGTTRPRTGGSTNE